MKIGVCWMADDGDGPGEAPLELDAWLPLFAQRGTFRYLTIQPCTLREDVERIRKETGMEIHDMGAELESDNLDDRVALLASCDVVISRSQLNLALAAAVGARAWPARTQGWSDCETTLPLPTPWPPCPDGKTQPAVCIARFHAPWGLPEKTTALGWLALEQESIRRLTQDDQSQIKSPSLSAFPVCGHKKTE